MSETRIKILSAISLTITAVGVILPCMAFAQIQWDKGQIMALGNIPVRTDTLLVFPFQNIGTGPISIDNVRTVCGCTMPEWDSKPILPGEGGELRVVFRPDRRGKLRKNMKVWFHGRNKPESLTIHAQAF